MSSLGKPGTPLPPAATRATRAGWRDPRLWIGLLLVAGSVVLGARVLAAADDTVSVWAVVGDHGAGSPLVSDDVVAVRVRFGHESDVERYLAADDPLPDDIVLNRNVGDGELLPSAALGSSGEAGTVEVPLDVDPGQVPPSVGAGSVVDVWVLPIRHDDDPEPALAAVTVVAAPPAEESFAVTGTRQLVVAVDGPEVGPFLSLLGGRDEPVVSIARVS